MDWEKSFFLMLEILVKWICLLFLTYIYIYITILLKSSKLFDRNMIFLLWILTLKNTLNNASNVVWDLNGSGGLNDHIWL